MLIPRYSLPRMIEVGATVAQAQTLDLDIYDDEAAAVSAQKTPSAGTITLLDGAVKVVDAATVTAGAPSTYSLPAASVTGQSLSETGLEVWSLTVSGVAYTFQRPAMFVRRVYRPVITDSDLTDGRHANLSDLRSSDVTSWAKYRREGDTWIQRSLISKGRRPWLIFDAWELREPHILYALGAIYRDAHASIGDGRYKELSELYLGKDGAPGLAQRALDSATFRYDGLQSGTIDTKEQQTATPAVILTSGPNRRGYDPLSFRMAYSGYRGGGRGF